MEASKVQVERVRSKPVKEGRTVVWTWRNRERPTARNDRSTMAALHQALEDADWEMRHALALVTVLDIHKMIGVRSLDGLPTEEQQRHAELFQVSHWTRKPTSDGVFYAWSWKHSNDLIGENDREIPADVHEALIGADEMLTDVLKNLTVQMAQETVAPAEQMSFEEHAAAIAEAVADEDERVTLIHPETGEIEPGDDAAEPLGDTGFTAPKPAAYAG